MKIFEAEKTDGVMRALIAMSQDWEREDSCHGYRANTEADILPNRVFLAEEDGKITGYLMGHSAQTQKATSIAPLGTRYFEIEELYVRPARRNGGIGRALFAFVEKTLAGEGEASCLMLSTATKDWRAILRFYIDELGMEFWNARLFKPLKEAK